MSFNESGEGKDIGEIEATSIFLGLIGSAFIAMGLTMSATLDSESNTSSLLCECNSIITTECVIIYRNVTKCVGNFEIR